MIRLNLLSRGLIVVGFPLVCQLAFALALCVLLVGVQAETQKQVESRSLISVGSKLVGDIGAFMFSFKGTYESPAEVAKMSQDVASISTEIQHLIDLANRKIVNKSELFKFCQDANSMLDLFSEWTLEHRRGIRPASTMRSYFNREANNRVKIFMRDLVDLTAEEESHFAKTSAEQQSFMTSIHNLFLLATFLSVLSAIALGYIYAQLVSAPIKRLTTNSTLLSQQKPLLPPLPSHDEFSELDNTLHQVASSLAIASANERAMIDNVENLICSLGQNGTFTALSPYVETMLGYQAQALLGKRLSEVVIADDLPLAEKELQSARQSGQERTLELRLKRKDGSIVDTRWSCFWSGSENSLFCVVNDNTEEKRIEQIKQEFVEMITDDLRAPLTAMKQAMESIYSGEKGPIVEATAVRFQGMIGSIDRLVLLTNDLLDSQRLQGGQLQLQLIPVDLSQVIKEAAEMMAGAAEAKQLQLVVKEGSYRVLADKQKLIEVLVNLLGNAIKFTPEQSTITVKAVETRDSSSAPVVEVSVTDCGPGVPAQYEERIFDAFEQVPDAKKSTGGVGLGLAICKMIVLAHGGTIGVRGAQPSGSTFWFCIAKAD